MARILVVGSPIARIQSSGQHHRRRPPHPIIVAGLGARRAGDRRGGPPDATVLLHVVTMVADGMTTEEILVDLPDRSSGPSRSSTRSRSRGRRRGAAVRFAETVRERQLPLHPAVRLLLDNNLSPRLAEQLRAAEHDVTHVRDLGLRAAPDTAVMQAAAAEARVLVSTDTDFGTLLARSGARVPSLVLVRKGSERVTRIELALSAWEADVLPLNYTRVPPQASTATSGSILTLPVMPVISTVCSQSATTHLSAPTA